MNKGINRRDFFKVAAASGAAAAVAGCGSDPVEEVLPMLVPPQDYVPGTTISFATTCNECSAQCGMVVRTREGRAIKAEGNTHNPLNQGRLCTLGQSSMQGMYAPTRAKGPATISGGTRTAVSWAEGKKLLSQKLKAAGSNGIVILGQPRSGSMVQLQQSFLKAFGGGKALSLDLTSAGSIKAANKHCFGKAEVPHYAIEDSKVLVSFGADFLEDWINPVQMTKAYTQMHAYKGGEKGKFIYVGPHMSLTASNADQKITCKVGSEAQIALAVANEIGAGGDLGKFLRGFDKKTVAANTGVAVEKIEALAKAFNKGGKSLAIAGGNSVSGDKATELQVAVNLLNQVAGNINKTVQFGADYQVGGDSVKEILKALNKGPKVLIIEGTNPLYSLPKDSGIEAAIKKAGFVVSLSTETDETSALADLHLPTSHYMESWGDAAPRKGVKTLQQPVMANLPGYDTQGLGDLLAELGGIATSYQEYIKNAWGLSSAAWSKALQNGGTYGNFRKSNVAHSNKSHDIKPSAAKEGLTLLAVNSTLNNANGVGGNRTWLMEIANPITQIVWDSWVEMNAATAIKLGVKHGDLVEVATSKGKQELGVWVNYGMADDAIAVPTGRGRMVPMPSYVDTSTTGLFTPMVEMASDVKDTQFAVGKNVMDLVVFGLDNRSGDLAFNETGVTVTNTGKEAWMVTPEGQARDNSEGLTGALPANMGDRSQKNRGFVQTTTPDVLSGKAEAGHYGHALKERHYTTDLPNNTDFYEERAQDIADHVEMSGRDKPVYYDPYKWEMSIDLDRCTGCSACVAACYAENNVPVVGKERMATGREMNWIRMERYIDVNQDTGEMETFFTPEMCNQCENAGCEPVCPVYATYHNKEGINSMVYNRCVGTRYCSNNCIYKQRRFNWRQYEFPAPLHMQLNPAITVREKGVMEKCNFCFSRIREAKDLAKDQGREVLDGEIQMACQQTCGADAITFGNIKDESSRVSKLNHTSKRTYKQLEEVNYKPSITYLQKVKHDNRKA